MNVTRLVIDGLRESPSDEHQHRFFLSLVLCCLSFKVVKTLCTALNRSKEVEVRQNSASSLSKISMPVIFNLIIFIVESLC